MLRLCTDRLVLIQMIVTWCDLRALLRIFVAFFFFCALLRTLNCCLRMKTAANAELLFAYEN
eukprot:SAG31_NODE_2575_length_5453_cov_7.045013_2_plen_62_part_00